ncbi:MAG: glycine C-acetyltransferase, partial [Pseudomonadota bacterium]
VVPQNQARIRTQMNAALSKDDLDFGLTAFEKAGQSVGVLK